MVHHGRRNSVRNIPKTTLNFLCIVTFVLFVNLALVSLAQSSSSPPNHPSNEALPFNDLNDKPIIPIGEPDLQNADQTLTMIQHDDDDKDKEKQTITPSPPPQREELLLFPPLISLDSILSPPSKHTQSPHGKNKGHHDHIDQCIKQHVVFVLDYQCGSPQNLVTYSGGTQRTSPAPLSAKGISSYYLRDWERFLEDISLYYSRQQDRHKKHHSPILQIYGEVFIVTPQGGTLEWFTFEDQTPLDSYNHKKEKDDVMIPQILINVTLPVLNPEKVDRRDICGGGGGGGGNDQIRGSKHHHHSSGLPLQNIPPSSQQQSTTTKVRHLPERLFEFKSLVSTPLVSSNGENHDDDPLDFSVVQEPFSKFDGDRGAVHDGNEKKQNSIHANAQQPPHDGTPRHTIDYVVLISTTGMSKQMGEKHLRTLENAPYRTLWVIADPANENMAVVQKTSGRRANRDYFVSMRIQDHVIREKSSNQDGIHQRIDDLAEDYRSKIMETLQSAMKASVCCASDRDFTQCGLCRGAELTEAEFCTDECRFQQQQDGGSSSSSHRYDLCGVCDGALQDCIPPVVSESLQSSVVHLNDLWIEHVEFSRLAYQFTLCIHGEYFGKGTYVQFGEGDRYRQKGTPKLDYHTSFSGNHGGGGGDGSMNLNQSKWKLRENNNTICATLSVDDLRIRFPNSSEVHVRVFDKYTEYILRWDRKGTISVHPFSDRVTFVRKDGDRTLDPMNGGGKETAVDVESFLHFAGDVGIKQVMKFYAPYEMQVEIFEEFSLYDQSAVPFLLTRRPQTSCVELASQDPSHRFECTLEIEVDTRDALGVIVFEGIKSVRISLSSLVNPKHHHVMIDQLRIFIRKHSDPYVENQLGVYVALFSDPEHKYPASITEEGDDVYGVVALKQPTYRIHVDYLVLCYGINGDLLPYDAGAPQTTGCNTQGGIEVQKHVLLYPNGTHHHGFTPLNSFASMGTGGNFMVTGNPASAAQLMNHPSATSASKGFHSLSQTSVESSYRFRFKAIPSHYKQIVQAHWHVEPIEGSLFVVQNYEDNDGGGGGPGLLAGLNDIDAMIDDGIPFGGHSSNRMSAFSKQLHGVMTDQRMHYDHYPFTYRRSIYSLPFPEAFSEHFKEEMALHLKQEELNRQIMDHVTLEGNLHDGDGHRRGYGSHLANSPHYVFYYPNHPAKSVSQSRAHITRRTHPRDGFRTHWDRYVDTRYFIGLLIALLAISGFVYCIMGSLRSRKSLLHSHRSQTLANQQRRQQQPQNNRSSINSTPDLNSHLVHRGGPTQGTNNVIFEDLNL